ncbi:MAG: DUF120 domain-containing protein [Candidatus Diapherotrites archaeon]
MVKESDFFLLLFLAEKTQFSNNIKLSTSEIASALEISQQSASRKLRNLEQKSLIKRNPTSSGIEISLTRKGKSVLKTHFNSLRKLFDLGDEVKEISGQVVSGFGEGKYYLSFKQYLSQISSKLGFLPFKGTLNFSVDEDSLLDFVSSLKEITIDGFKTDERAFGSIKCFPVLINSKIEGALVLPERTKHKGIAELIAPLNLRNKFKLKDGSKINISVK